MKNLGSSQTLSFNHTLTHSSTHSTLLTYPCFLIFLPPALHNHIIFHCTYISKTASKALFAAIQIPSIVPNKSKD